MLYPYYREHVVGEGNSIAGALNPEQSRRESIEKPHHPSSSTPPSLFLQDQVPQ